MADFTLEPRGPFSLAATASFIAGWPPGQGRVDDDEVRLRLPRRRLERAGARRAAPGRRRDPRHCRGRQRGSRDRAGGADRLARPRRHGYPEVGERDPIVGELQRASGYLRPVLFHSPYEAAAWSVISARTATRWPPAARRALRDGIFPAPEQLLELHELDGLPANKVPRLHGIAEAALEGSWTASRCSHPTPTTPSRSSWSCRASARSTPGLILLRAVGTVDVAPKGEPRLEQRRPGALRRAGRDRRRAAGGHSGPGFRY